MPDLKSLRLRINSVKATQKITKAMQMVAASKLRRAQEEAEAARPYAERMEGMLRAIAGSVAGNDNAPAMLAGSGASDTHLLLVTFLIPVSAIALGILILGEQLGARHFAGMAVIGLSLAAIDGRLYRRLPGQKDRSI